MITAQSVIEDLREVARHIERIKRGLDPDGEMQRNSDGSVYVAPDSQPYVRIFIYPPEERTDASWGRYRVVDDERMDKVNRPLTPDEGREWLRRAASLKPIGG